MEINFFALPNVPEIRGDLSFGEVTKVLAQSSAYAPGPGIADWRSSFLSVDVFPNIDFGEDAGILVYFCDLFRWIIFGVFFFLQTIRPDCPLRPDFDPDFDGIDFWDFNGFKGFKGFGSFCSFSEAHS